MKLSILDTVNFLISKGIIDNSHPTFSKRLSDYLMRQIKYRNKILSFWKSIKGCEEKINKNHIEILTVMGLNGGNADVKAVKDIFGYSNKTEMLEKLVVTSSIKSSSGGCNRLFIGKGWKDICVLAAFDMPGRIISFVIFGKILDNKPTVVVRNVCYRAWNKYDNESGLLFMEEAINDDSKEKILETDTFQGLRIVVDYLDKYKKFPQIVVSPPQEDKRPTSMKTFIEEGKTVIVTGSRTDELVGFNYDVYLSTFSQPWDSPWVGSKKWIDKIIEEKKKRTLETSPKLDTRKRVLFNGDVFEEKNGYTLKNGLVVMDAIMVIERIKINNHRPCYVGTITTASGKSIRFEEYIGKVDHVFYKWLNRLAIKNKLGHVMCRRGFASYAAKISLLLNPICERKEEDNKESDLIYRFSKYDVSSAGEVIEAKGISKNRDGALITNEELDIFEKEELGNEKNGFVWSIIIACTSNLLAKLTNKPKVGIGVNPECFDEVKRIAVLLGSYDLTLPSNKNVFERVLKFECGLNLPVVLSTRGPFASIQNAAIQQYSGQRNCIIKISEMSLNGARTITRWVYIGKNNAHIPSPVLDSACKKFVLNFLTWIIKSNYRPEGSHGIRKAIDSLTAWCVAENITLDGLHSGVNLLDHDMDKSDAKSISDSFKNLVGKFIPMSEFLSNLSYIMREDETWLACTDFYNMCKKLTIPITDRGTLSKALLQTGTVKSYEIFKPSKHLSWGINNKDLKDWENYA